MGHLLRKPLNILPVVTNKKRHFGFNRQHGSFLSRQYFYPQTFGITNPSPPLNSNTYYSVITRPFSGCSIPEFRKPIEQMSEREFENYLRLEVPGLRKELNAKPCPSRVEEETLNILNAFFEKHIPKAKLYPNIGGAGLVVEFNFGGNKAKGIVIRADMDAVPVKKPGSESIYNHQCGHDGHMAILAETALLMSRNPFKEGRVLLLFQPAEETAEGAKAVFADPTFQGLIKEIDQPYFIALHNLPGFTKGKVIISHQKAFSSAVTSRKYKIKGHSSHAANPEEGLNPAYPVTNIISKLPKIQKRLEDDDIWHKITIVHSQVGEEWNFGTSPADGELCLTFRARTNDDLAKVIKEFEKEFEKTLEESDYELETSIHDNFPATENNEALSEILVRICEEENILYEYVKQPFSWGEDFGVFLLEYPGIMFGLGSGEKNSGLHTTTYEFPDKIIPVGAKVFYKLAEKMVSAK